MFERRLHGLRLSGAGEKLGPVLARAFNKNQILILNEIANEKGNLTAVLNGLAKRDKIPLSTLKMNAHILLDLDLIVFENSKTAEITNLGKFVLTTIQRNNAKSPHSSSGRAVGCNPTDAGSSLAEETVGIKRRG